MKKKMSTTVEELCAGLPNQFCSYFNYVRGLKFDEAPRYGQLRQLFRNLFIQEGYVYDYIFDWVLVKQQVITM